MTKKNPPRVRALKDTRGLTADQDPRMFYEYSSQRRKQQANGLEGLLYKLIPLEVFRNTAYAVDPFAQLKIGAGRVTPGTRYREKTHSDVLDYQVRTILGYIETNGSPTWDRSVVQVGQQNLPPSWSYDTTKKTRLSDSDLGELMIESAYIDSSERQLSRTHHSNIWNGGAEPSGLDRLTSVDHVLVLYSRPSALIDYYAAIEPWNEQSLAFGKMQEHSIRLFSRIKPQKRVYTLARNIVELRDIPRGILTLRASIRSLQDLFASLNISKSTSELLHSLKTVQSQVPREYLSYWFGWRQTYSDVVGLLTSPSKIGKKIDFLIRRNAKPTTLRTQQTFVEYDVPSTGFTYETSIEDSVELSHLRKRTTELKMVCNTIFDFPPTDLPNFRQKEFYRQLGLVLTPLDLYNLVPWTWLVDWFTGFGNYLEVIESINSDSNLINWGLITAKVDVELETQYVGKVVSSEIRGVTGDTSYDESVKSFSHVSKLHYSLQLRSDLATIMNVNTTADKQHLSAYQLSILGAILSNYTKFSR